MHHVSSHRAERTTHRSQRPSISPYFVEDTGLTIADIQRARNNVRFSFRCQLTSYCNCRLFVVRG